MKDANLYQLLIVLLPIVLPPLISVSSVLYKKLIQNLPEQRRSMVEQVVNSVVSAIEQTANDVTTSADKKQAAVTLVQQVLKELGIPASPTTISVMIEAAVYALNQMSTTSTPSNNGSAQAYNGQFYGQNTPTPQYAQYAQGSYVP
ncbi:phage holin, LLH family [Ktedonobacter racemifer]|uniref:Phage holin, LL-H family n=1 Tax=Ktedonobacter racemifer DSM 44963 TaxID=485913 RepID=D6TM38_KTERA|nr:phage holin, LLH family [Ktedonobacter racemifer]EFH86838.1 phage holin, LL-H family [Ktedonobacter racemifer DSM 44963]